MVRAKFTCDSIIPQGNGDKSVQFHAVYSHDGENASFSTSTPSGQLSMWINASTPAVDYFQQGKDYYLDFTECIIDQPPDSDVTHGSKAE